VLSAAPDFMSKDAAPVPRVARERAQAIERASEFPWPHGWLSRHTAQALPSTCFSAMNDALQSRKMPPLAFSSPQRAWFWPQDFACSRGILGSSRNPP
jgi:hypothetical protein